MYTVQMSHCSIYITDYDFIIKPSDNTIKEFRGCAYFNYDLFNFGFRGCIDRTNEVMNGTFKLEACNIDGKVYDHVKVEITELPMNPPKNIQITVYDERGKVIYKMCDIILKGGKYDED